MGNSNVRLAFALVCAFLAGCVTTRPGPVRERPPEVRRAEAAATPDRCTPGLLRVTFFDVGQALSALVELPDNRRVLVDTGEAPNRAGCGAVCKTKSADYLNRLKTVLGGADATIDLLWVTHQHSDHLGNAVELLNTFKVKHYVDNGTELSKPMVVAARAAAQQRGTEVASVNPTSAAVPLASTSDVTIAAVVPSSFEGNCSGSKQNDGSIPLRISYCDSSMLFVGDAEEHEEHKLDAGQVTLLQVGHHGSDTSTSPEFVAQVAPKYAVISAGKRSEGLNRGYCHPFASTVSKLSAALGDTDGGTVYAFDGCGEVR